jgi:hypothetical protein
MHLGLNWQALCAPYSVLGYRSPALLAKFQMAPMPSTLISSGSKKREPRYACMSEANASHSHRMWTEVSSSLPHFLQMGSLRSTMICKCLLKVLCPISRPVTTLVCVLLKDNSRAPIAGWGPEINSRPCLCVLKRPRHNTYIHTYIHTYITHTLTLILLMWKIRRAPNNASTWQMGFNSAFKGLNYTTDFVSSVQFRNKLNQPIQSLAHHVRTSKHFNPLLLFLIQRYAIVQYVFLLLSWAPQLSRDVPAKRGFLCGKALVLGETIKGTPCITPSVRDLGPQLCRYRWLTSRCFNFLQSRIQKLRSH